MRIFRIHFSGHRMAKIFFMLGIVIFVGNNPRNAEELSLMVLVHSVRFPLRTLYIHTRIIPDLANCKKVKILIKVAYSNCTNAICEQNIFFVGTLFYFDKYIIYQKHIINSKNYIRLYLGFEPGELGQSKTDSATV